MKKIILSFTLFIAIMLTACEKCDSDQASNQYVSASNNVNQALVDEDCVAFKNAMVEFEQAYNLYCKEDKDNLKSSYEISVSAFKQSATQFGCIY